MNSPQDEEEKKPEEERVMPYRDQDASSLKFEYLQAMSRLKNEEGKRRRPRMKVREGDHPTRYRMEDFYQTSDISVRFRERGENGEKKVC
jgi:hypothetical protein